MISYWVIPGILERKPELILDKRNFASINEFTEIALEKIAGHFGEHPTAPGRKGAVIKSRKFACYFLIRCKLYKFTLMQVGEILGYPDHATVLHHVRDIEGYIDIKDKMSIETLDKLNLLIYYK